MSSSARLQDLLAARLDDSQNRALAQLRREDDPELFAEGVLTLGRRAQNSDNLEVATALYRWLQSEEAPAVASVRERAGRELDAIEGRGDFGGRAEFLLRRFVGEAADPSALFAMGAAGALFRVTRLATMARLAAHPEARLLSRGFGAQAVAALGGFGVEATAFPLLHRLGDQALGRRRPWELRQVGHEVASSFFTLGALKLCGWGAGAAFRRVHGTAPALPPSLTQQAFQQVGMFGGILLGHGLESNLGLRPRQEGATTLVDSLVLLLQFNVAGSLSRRAFGSNFHQWERSLDLQTESLQGRQIRLPALDFGALTVAMSSGKDSIIGRAHIGSGRSLAPSRSRAGKIVSMQTEVESQMRAPGYLEGNRGELLAKRIDSDLADRIFLHQAMEALRKVPGIEARIVDDSVLYERLAADREAPNSDLVDRARERLGRRGVPGSVARKVIEVHQRSTLPEGEAMDPLIHLMELLSFLQNSQESLGHQIHFVNEANNPNYVGRIVMPSYLESLLQEVHGESAMQFHYVDGAIPRDDVMRLRSQRVAPIGFSRVPVYLEDVQGEVPPFTFSFHDGYFHAPIDSAKRGSYPEWSGRLYRLLRARNDPSYEARLSGLSELHELIRADATPTLGARDILELLTDLSRTVRAEPETLERGRLLGEIHALTQGLAAIAEERFPVEGARNEVQTEFVRGIETLWQAVNATVDDIHFAYPSEIEAAWSRVERHWQDPAYYNGNAEELLARRPEADDVDAIWLHQAMDYASRLGARVEVLDASQLRDEVDRHGRNHFEPEFFDRLMERLGERGREGSIARRVIRVHFSNEAMAALGLANPFLRYLGLTPSLEEVEEFSGRRVQLLNFTSGERGAQADYLSLSLTEAILQNTPGKPGTQFHYVPGAIPRDRVMSLRSRRASPIGLARGLTFLDDVGFEIHPFCFAGHDAKFHAARDAEQPDPFPGLGGEIYGAAASALPEGRIREQILDNLSDSNLGGGQGTWESFADAVLLPLRNAVVNSQLSEGAGPHRISSIDLRETLPKLAELFSSNSSLPSELRDRSELFQGRIGSLTQNVRRIQSIQEDYRTAAVSVSPPYYNIEALNAIERIDARFREPGYMEGSREELRRKRVDIQDADLLWYAQARDFIRLIPDVEDHLEDSSFLSRPAAGRDGMRQDRALIDEAIARAASKSPGSEEARRVTVINVPINFMVSDLEGRRPELAFLRFDPFLNDLEAHLDNRVQFIESKGGRKIFRLPSLAMIESLLEAAYGEDRARLHFVRGEISRDDTARLRGLRASPVGLSFSPLYIEEFKGPMHSFSFVQHDALDHASRDASRSPGIPGAMYWLYREVQAAFPETPARERLLDRLADLDLPSIHSYPWDNLSSLLLTSSSHEYGNANQYREYMALMKDLIRRRFAEQPDLAAHRDAFLLDLATFEAENR